MLCNLLLPLRGLSQQHQRLLHLPIFGQSHLHHWRRLVACKLLIHLNQTTNCTNCTRGLERLQSLWLFHAATLCSVCLVKCRLASHAYLPDLLMCMNELGHIDSDTISVPLVLCIAREWNILPGFDVCLSSLVDGGWYWLTTILKFCVLKKFKLQLNESYFWVSEQIKPLSLQPIGQAALPLQSSSLSLSSSPCVSFGNHSWRLFQKTIEGFGQALTAKLRRSLGWLNGRAQTQGVSESAAVAVGQDRLAWGKSATSLAILTLSDSFRESKKFLMLCRYWAATSKFS